MAEKKKFETQVGDKTLKVQIGGLADQCSGSCFIQMGDTSVLATAQMGNEAAGLGFFPLTCDYEERYYAAGKILGSRFVRREGRPSSEATLNARMIDRAIRPLFPANFKREAQAIATCLSWDTENDPATLGLLGVSIALSISPMPWQGPVAVVRVGRIDGQFILFPSYEQRLKTDLDIILAGVEQDNEILINMIEAKAEELNEEVLLGAYDFALPFLRQLIDFQKEIIGQVGKAKVVLADSKIDEALGKRAQEFLAKKIEEILYRKNKSFDRSEVAADLAQIQKEYLEMVKVEFGDEKITDAKIFWETIQENILDEKILKDSARPDGRALDEVRAIEVDVSILPRTHGAGLFTRGQTRVLSILTLGGPGDQQLLEGMDFSGKKRFMHHYNFPPYSAGEVKRLVGPGRREIGHGMLAEKALLPMIPSFDEFPYTIRIVSEVLTSNGSTSQAAISAASLALMDAGVPIKRPVTGIAVGLIKKDNQNYKLLTDIQGPEDHFGDMDFKIAGTTQGITAIQMDVKTDGITRKIMEEAMARGKKARLEILEKMKAVLPGPRAELSPFAPRVAVVQINPDKIGAVIGSGGKVINSIIEECGVAIDIEEDGRVFVSGTNDEGMQKAIEWIKGLAKEFKPGEEFQGTVKRIMDFGAFVEVAPGVEGLVHISQLAPVRIERVEDVVEVGDVIPVKLTNVDDQGRLNFSAKDAGFNPEIKQSTPALPRDKAGYDRPRPTRPRY
ncbi:MAG: polyribonucleotide nucleotidyltransferase [Candidatus Gribaldobacteria bacterium]|nr:polyribonucleotide nucleotidyltransferase [Candidatus Gribaldobacteria bacterium]